MPGLQQENGPATATLRANETSTPRAESYEVREEIGQPPPDSVAYQGHVSFACRCGTRWLRQLPRWASTDLPGLRPSGHGAAASREAAQARPDEGDRRPV